jgi:basic membrane protein A
VFSRVMHSPGLVLPGALTRRQRLTALAGLVLVVAAGSAAVAGAGTNGSTPLKIVWLYYGPKVDKGWNSTNALAADKVAATYGNRVKNVDAVNVPFSNQATQIAQQEVAQGAKVLVDFSGFGPLVTKVCAQHPEINCIEVAPQGPMPPNTVGWTPHYWAAEYVAGVAAGSETKTNTTGYILPYQIPLAYGPLNSFALGCRSVNPKCIVRTEVTNNYYNPPVEDHAASTLLNAHADVLRGWLNDQAFCIAAQKRGVKAVGEFYDTSKQCPRASITTVLMNFNKFYVGQIGSILNHRFKHANFIVLSVRDSIALGKFGSFVPQKVRARVQTTLAKLASGKLYPWTGPIRSSNGALRVPPGKRLSYAFIYGKWKWFVAGVVR